MVDPWKLKKILIGWFSVLGIRTASVENLFEKRAFPIPSPPQCENLSKKNLEWRVCFDGEGDLIEGTFTKLFHKCQILWICSCSDIIVELALSLLGDRQKGTIVKEPKHVRNYALSWKQVKQLLKKKPIVWKSRCPQEKLNDYPGLTNYLTYSELKW